MFLRTYHYFVHQVRDTADVDRRCPTGGVAVRAWSEIVAVDKAFREAARRFPCKPYELLMLLPARTATERKHVDLMDRDWERAYRKFEELLHGKGDVA